MAVVTRADTALLAGTVTSMWNEAAPPNAVAMASGPFTIRRIPNPRYRPPVPGTSPLASPTSTSRLRALDRLTAQVFQNEPPGAHSITHWQLTAGQQSRNEDALEGFAAGGQRFGRAELEGLRLSGRRGKLSGAAGDLAALTLSHLATFQRLRGGLVRLGTAQADVLALGGVPTPVPGQATPRLALAGLVIDGLRAEAATVSLTGIAFARGEAAGAAMPEERPGRGGLGSFAWKAPVGGSWLSQRIGAQLHDADGVDAFALQHELEWSLVTSHFAATLASERNSRQSLLLGTDRFAPAPRREDRWSLQARSSGGRSETHTTGIVRQGGEVALETQTIAWGASGSFGRSGWYGGADATWDSRPGVRERRFALQTGCASSPGVTFLSRLEYGERPSTPGSLAALAEASFALPRGARLELEPRLGFAERQFQHGQLTTRWSGGIGVPGLRMTGTLAVGAVREEGFRGTVREAALTISCSPRLRDRGDLEIRRMDQDGRPAMEYSASYDAMVSRYEPPAEWIAARDTGRVTVIAGRAGNGSGMPDVLVSLDGQLLRFTDADGVARFDHVTPGIHTIAVEERSLDENAEVTGTSRAFVTVERGRVPETVRFTIGRKEKRTRF